MPFFQRTRDKTYLLWRKVLWVSWGTVTQILKNQIWNFLHFETVTCTKPEVHPIVREILKAALHNPFILWHLSRLKQKKKNPSTPSYFHKHTFWLYQKWFHHLPHVDTRKQTSRFRKSQYYRSSRCCLSLHEDILGGWES